MKKKNDPQSFCHFEITDSENVVREMPKKSRLREFFDKQHGKRAKALLKSASQHLYHMHWSLPTQLCWKKSLLLTCRILGLLVNTLAADEKHLFLIETIWRYQFRCNYLRNKKVFLYFFCFIKISIKSWIFWKKRWPSELLYFRYYGLRTRE